MYEIELLYPFHEQILYYSTLSAASRDLKISDYFIRNIYHKKHKNQFSRFIRIKKCQSQRSQELSPSSPQVSEVDYELGDNSEE